MHKAIIIITILSVAFGCRKKKDDDDAAFWLALAAANNIGWELSECRGWSGWRNGIYNAGGYEFRFATDAGVYDALIIGNSTMDLANQYAGWFGAGTTNRAVAGNTLCDMTEQSPSWPRNKQIDFILISTDGGNDALQRLPVDSIVESGRLLLSRVRERFSAAFICLVDIHPTRDNHANAVKDEINERIAAQLDGNGARVNLLDVFGKSPGEPADIDQMYEGDGIHYSKAMGWRVREAVKDNCGRYP